MEVRVGTRKSALARVQGSMVRDALIRGGLAAALVEVESHGDADLKTPLYEMDPLYPGVFTKHLESALLAGRVDLAVHSMKDLPTRQPDGLRVVACSRRETTVDRLFLRPDRLSGGELLGLPKGAKVGTSSLRREAQLLSQRPDLELVPIRGNVQTRLAAAREGRVDAVVLAGAGIDRLGIVPEGLVARELSPELFISAPAQGVVAVEARDDLAPEAASALAAFHDPVSEREAAVERLILRGLDGGCTLPLGVRCFGSGGELRVRAFLGVSRDRKSGKKDWLGFHYYDGQGASIDDVVRAAVAFFKGVMP